MKKTFLKLLIIFPIGSKSSKFYKTYTLSSRITSWLELISIHPAGFTL